MWNKKFLKLFLLAAIPSRKAAFLAAKYYCYLIVTWRVVSSPPRRRVEDTSGLCSGLPSSPGSLDRLQGRAFRMD